MKDADVRDVSITCSCPLSPSEMHLHAHKAGHLQLKECRIENS